MVVFGGYWFVYHFIAKPSITGMAVFNVAFFLAFWSYLAASLTNPGTPECTEWQMWARKLGPQLALTDGLKAPRSWMPGSPAFCGKCAMWRPERAHHCKSLGICVLRMDHFCPWIGNCVGFRNHKQFVLMNFYITVASLIGLLTLHEPNAIKALTDGMCPSATNDHMHSGFARTALSIAVLICLMFTFVTSVLFANGLHQAALNVTQIESKYKGQNPYLLPTTWENMKQLFGSCSIWLFFPVHTTGSDSVGTTFPYKNVEITTPGGYGSIDPKTVSAVIP
jgi:hypothetical protein